VSSGPLLSRRPATSRRLLPIERDTQRLLAAVAAPPELVSTGTSYLSNDDVAALFPDPRAASQAMAEAGRVEGARAEYQLRPVAPAGQPVATIVLTVAVYSTAAAAGAVLADPALGLAVQHVAGPAAEMAVEPGDEPLRMFRSVPTGGQADQMTYIVQFQRNEIVTSVVVTRPAGADDGGELALNLARGQAKLVQSPGAAPGSASGAGAGPVGQHAPGDTP
jgi:hypothetical protein